MGINNPLIKARETGLIINKTADIYKLLIQKREERESMTKKPYFNTLEMLRVLAGQGFSSEIKVTSEQAKAVHQIFEEQTRVFNHLPRTLSRYAATGAPVVLQQKPTAADDKQHDNTPRFKK